MSGTELLDQALKNREGVIANNGAFVVTTGTRTGRSPGDRFIVDDNITHNTVAWGKVNKALSQEKFSALWQRASDYLASKQTYQADLAVGADPEYQIPVSVTSDLAWHVQFCINLFIRDVESTAPKWTLLSAANFKTDPQRDGVNSDAAIILNFSERKVLVCGSHYAGEMKKPCSLY